MSDTSITADDIARAVVAACRETGEDPLTIATAYTMKARHFAYHALLNVFPDTGRTAMARMLGVPKPGFFHRTSMWFIVGQGPHNHRRADWFTDAALGRVITAVAWARENRTPADLLLWGDPAKEKVLTGLLTGSKKSTAKVVEKIDTTKSRGVVVGHDQDVARQHEHRTAGSGPEVLGAKERRFESGPRDAPPPARYGEKRKLEKMLADAVRNTAKLSKNNRGG